MAESRVSRKFRVYQGLYEINNAFQNLDNSFETMVINELLEPDSVGVWCNRLFELQAEINTDLTGKLHQRESREIRRLGPIVEQWEESGIAGATARKMAKRKKSTTRK